MVRENEINLSKHSKMNSNISEPTSDYKMGYLSSEYSFTLRTPLHDTIMEDMLVFCQTNFGDG